MIVGIDLGTTNSLVAVFTEEGPVIIPNRLGKHLTPSVVSVDENGNVYVGETAQERRNLYPDSVAQAFKRSMGTDRTYDLSGKKFRPEELSSMILRYLKEDAEVYLGEEVTEAVISVPAYFDDKRRKATKRAGELAGLKVERMISEPTAAAVAYGLYEKEKDTRFLVFDLGGGTFDVSILELYHNILEVRAVAGDNYLGGEDFTEVMSKLFLQKTGLHYKHLSEKEQVRLYKKAEEAKRGISDQTAVTMELMLGEENKTAEITLKEYEEECEELLMKIREPVKKSLADAGLKLSDIDEVLLIGGATRLSVVRDFLIRLFRKFPDTRLNPVLYIRLINNRSIGQTVLWNCRCLIRNHYGNGACSSHIGIHPFVRKTAADHALSGRSGIILYNDRYGIRKLFPGRNRGGIRAVIREDRTDRGIGVTRLSTSGKHHGDSQQKRHRSLQKLPSKFIFTHIITPRLVIRVRSCK